MPYNACVDSGGVVMVTADDLTHDLTRTVLPVTILIIVESVLGIIGNILILIVYYKWYKLCNFRCFVLHMACIDLLSSVTTLPGEVFSHSKWYTYQSDTICKAKSFFNVFTVWASALILLMLAYDRNRKICHPLSWQLLNHVAHRLCVGCILFSLIIASPTAVFWGTQTYHFTKGNVTVKVSICEKSDAYVDGKSPFIFIVCAVVVPIALIMLVTVNFNVCTGRKLLDGMGNRYGAGKIADGCIAIRTLVDEDSGQNDTRSISDSEDDIIQKLKNTKRRFSFPTGRHTFRREQMKNGVSSVKHELNDIPETKTDVQTFSTMENLHTCTKVTVKKNNSQSDADIRTPTRARQLERWRRRVMTHKLHSRRRKTMIMFTLSTVFIVTTTVYLILVCLVANTDSVLRQLTDSQKMVFFLFWRLYFINCLINPVLYGCMDLRFRKGLLRLFGFKTKLYPRSTMTT